MWLLYCSVKSVDEHHSICLELHHIKSTFKRHFTLQYIYWKPLPSDCHIANVSMIPIVYPILLSLEWIRTKSEFSERLPFSAFSLWLRVLRFITSEPFTSHAASKPYFHPSTWPERRGGLKALELGHPRGLEGTPKNGQLCNAAWTGDSGGME